MEKQGGEDHDKHRGGELEHDGIGRRGQLVGQHKAGVDAGGEHAGEKGAAAEHKAVFFQKHVHAHGGSGNQGAQPGHGKAVPGQKFNKDPAGAPQRGADQHFDNGFVFFFHIGYCLGLIWIKAPLKGELSQLCCD